MNLTVQQLKRIVKEAEANMEGKYFADDIITLHVEPTQLTVTQPIQKEAFGNVQNVTIFDKSINTTYTK